VISQFRAAKVDFEVNLYSGAAHGFYQAAEPLGGCTPMMNTGGDDALSQGSLGALNVAFLWVFVARASAMKVFVPARSDRAPTPPTG